MEFLFVVFMMFSAIFHIILLVGIIHALMGYLNKELTEQAKQYAVAAKCLLLYALYLVVGVGGCFVVLSFM